MKTNPVQTRQAGSRRLGPRAKQQTKLPVIPEYKPQDYSVATYENERGWFEQNMKDAWDILSGIPQVIWQASKNVADGTLKHSVTTIFDSLVRDPDVLAAASKRVLRDAWYGATEHYSNPQGNYTAESIATAPFRRPLLVGLDALALLSGGTSAMTKTVRPMTALAKTVGVSPMRFARGWLRAAEIAKKAPAKAMLAGLKAAGNAPGIKQVRNVIGMGPVGQRLSELWGTADLRNMAVAHDEWKKIEQLGIPPELQKEFADILDGKPWDRSLYPDDFNKRIEATANFNDRVWADQAEHNFYLQNPQTGKFDLPYTPEAREQAQLKKFADTQLPEVYRGDIDRARVMRELNLEATERLSGPEARKIQEKLFRPDMAAYHMDAGDALYSIFNPGSRGTHAGGAEFFKRFRGGSDEAKELNPNIYQGNYLASQARQAAFAEFQERGLAEFGKFGTPGSAEIPRDFVPLPVEFTPQNTNIQRMALGKLRAKEAEGLASGLDAVAAKERAWADTMLDLMPEVEKMEEYVTGKTGQWFVPKEYAQWLKLHLQPTGPVMKAYEKYALNPWRDIVLSWSGRTYLNNVLSNAGLMLWKGIIPTWKKGRNTANLAAEAERITLQLEQRGLFGGIGRSAPVRWARRWQDKTAFATDAIPRIETLNHEAGVAAREMRAADKMASQFVQLPNGTQPRLNEINDLVQAMATARAEDIARQGTRLSRAAGDMGVALADAERTKRLAPLVTAYEGAIKDMERLLGPYGRGNPFVRKYIRRIIPFWTFNSTMARLAFMAPFIRPKTTWLYSNMAQMAQEAWDDERLPDWLKGTAYLGGNDKSMLFARTSGLNLFDSLNFREIGGVPIPKLIDPRNNPFISAYVRMEGGYDNFTQDPAPTDGYQFRDTAGRVWEMQHGKFVRVSPQTKLWDAFGELIPHISAVNDIMAGLGFSQIPGKGPKLYRGPDGKFYSPRHWMVGVGKLIGVNTGVADLNRAREADQLNTLRLARMFGKKAMQSPDEWERNQILKELAEMERRFNRPRKR